MPESFKFYRSYLLILQELEPVDGYEFARAIAEYAINGKKPKLKKSLQIFFEIVKPNIDADIRRYVASVANAQKGGAPKGNQNAKKCAKISVNAEQQACDEGQKTTYKQPKNNLEQPKTTLNSKKQRAINGVNCDLLANNNKNILLSLTEKTRAKIFSMEERRFLLSDNFEYHEQDKFGEAMLEVADTLLETCEIAKQGDIKFNNKIYTESAIQKLITKQGRYYVDLIAPKIALKQDIKNRPLYILGIAFAEYDKNEEM